MYMIDYFVSVVYIRYMYGLWLIDGDTRYSAEISSIYKKNINKYIEYNERERERERERETERERERESNAILRGEVTCV
jgi:hypothetical protein